MNKINDRSSKLRYNLLTTIVYIIGIILLIQLFNLQIIHGEEYRETSNTRLTRESVLRAARGSIKDRTGIELVTNETGFGLEIYQTKADDATINSAIDTMIKILEENKDKFVDNLPIKVNPFKFTQKEEKDQKEWKKNNNIDENATAEQAFNFLKDKYKIENDDLDQARKIMAVRYEITRNGYSATRSVKIASDISRNSAVKIREQNSSFSGMNIITEPIVKYTSGSLASHILGYVGAIDEEEYATRESTYRNDDVIGKNGVQYIFEDYLKGQDGIKQIDMAVDGTITSEYVSKEAVAGSDVVLTIDANLQAVAEKALKANIKKIASGGFGKKKDAKAGAVVVMNVKTGEVLALASYPDYEPGLFVKGISEKTYNSYKKENNLYNRAVSGNYAPGSTFKMAVALAGLETNKITTKSTINDTGIYPRGGNPVCWYYTSYRSGHGYLNVSQAIKHSCNYFFYELGYRVGIDGIAKYANYLGLGKKTGIELEGETSGILASPQVAKDINGADWYLGDTLSAAIGQSYNSFSPLQMAKYVSMLANGGKDIDVTLIKSIIKADGTEVSKEEINKYTNEKLGLKDQKTEDLNVKSENIQAILKGMKGVTSESGGTAYSTFADFNIELGGKTGSAQIGVDGKDGAHAWFVGFAPYDDPEIAVVVLVEKGGTGGYTAEVAKQIIAEYFGMNANSVTENMQAISSSESVR